MSDSTATTAAEVVEAVTVSEVENGNNVNTVHTSEANLPAAPSEDGKKKKKPVKERLRLFIHSTAASVYVSKFLSAWGDRMWTFAVGVYLADLSPNNLRLVASYGFTLGLAAVLMGATIGDIVDKYPRMKVARTVLACQNILVALCATLVCFVYTYKSYIYSEKWISGLCEAGIIVLSVVANLFSTALKISVEKDWVGVICEGDSAKLAKLSSVTRGLDQFTKLTAPALTGLLMTYGSMFISAIFVAVWNVCSVVVEYTILVRIYNMVPALAVKQSPTDEASDVDVAEVEVIVPDAAPSQNHTEEQRSGEDNSMNNNISPNGELKKPVVKQATMTTRHSMPHVMTDGSIQSRGSATVKNRRRRKGRKTVLKIFSVFINIIKGWSVYFGYEVKFAGIGLALIYMTVLGFDNITIGYAYSQGASQALLGGISSLGAVVGISSTIAYPWIRKRIGIEYTGLLGYSTQIAVLSLCVISVWSPGSPFDLSTQTDKLVSTTMSTVDLNYTMVNSTTTSGDVKVANSPISLALLLTGISAARFGLWLLDLTISQLLIERVQKSKRGVVNGVQGSLNMLLDVLKFLLVILVPSTRHFGILVILSFAFVCSGAITYATYVWRMKRTASQDATMSSSLHIVVDEQTHP